MSVKAHLGIFFNASMATVGEIREHIHSLSKKLDVHIRSISEVPKTELYPSSHEYSSNASVTRQIEGA